MKEYIRILPEIEKDYLTGLKNKSTKYYNIFGFDTETYEGKLYSFQLNYYNYDTKSYEEKIIYDNFFYEFIYFLIRNSDRKYPSVIFAHNLAYDISEFIRSLSEIDSDYEKIFLFETFSINFINPITNETNKLEIDLIYGYNSYCKIIIYDKDDKQIYTFHFIDTQILFKGRLALMHKFANKSEIVKKIGQVKKLSSPAFLGYRKPDKDKNYIYVWKDKSNDEINCDEFDEKYMNILFVNEDIYFKDYSIMDIRVTICLGDLIIKAVEKYNLNVDFLVSSASMAEKMFRTHYLDKAIIRDNNLKLFKKDFITYTYHSYYGARSEVFKIGMYDKVKIYDITNSYGYSMIQPLPFNNVKFNFTKKFNEDKNLFGFYKVKLFSYEDNHIPLLPLKLQFNESDNRLLFPNGEFTTWVNHDELLFALKNSKIEIDKIEGYEREITEYDINHPLRQFIIDNKELRDKAEREKNEFESDFRKLNINGLYGKFCQTTEIDYIEYDNLEFQSMFMKKELNDNSDEKLIRKLSGALFLPRIASYITSNARMRLNEVILSTDVLLTHTDSCWTTKNIDEKYLTNFNKNEIGKWKLEGKNGKAMILRAGNYVYEGLVYDKKIKDYSQKKKIARHAFWGKDEEFFKWLFYGKGKQLDYSVKHIIKLKSHFRRNIDLHKVENMKRMHDTKPDLKRKRLMKIKDIKKIRDNPQKTIPFNVEELKALENKNDFDLLYW